MAILEFWTFETFRSVGKNTVKMDILAHKVKESEKTP